MESVDHLGDAKLTGFNEEFAIGLYPDEFDEKMLFKTVDSNGQQKSTGGKTYRMVPVFYMPTIDN